MCYLFKDFILEYSIYMNKILGHNVNEV